MIWLIGCKGMLGRELSILLKKSGFAFAETDCDVDITNLQSLEQYGKDFDFKWIVNCAAYTAVDKAENDVNPCRRINTYGAANIALYAKNIGASLIHISTDYVFDGKGINEKNSLRPYREDDTTNPVSVYGLTKYDGEIAVMENNLKSFIIRTAWLYGKYGKNFVNTMLRLMNERDEIKVVDDQRGSPTWAYDLSMIILTLIKSVNCGMNIPFGIYHYTNEGDISWFDFSREIYRQGSQMGLVKKNCLILPCASAEYPSKVQRPVFSVLDKSKIKAALGITIPAWDESLKEHLKDCAP